MPTIDRMNRFGRNYTIRLSCGHSMTRTPEEAKDEQLYVGKRIDCPWCGAIESVERLEGMR